MYQDKIEQEAKDSVLPSASKFDYSIFENSALEPLSFIPEEADSDATEIARDILIKRNTEEVIKISKSIKYMLKLGEQLLQSLALNQLRTGQRICVSLSEGRSLYLLHHFFDIKALKIKNLKWGEVFATLVLMQSAAIKSISIREYGDDDVSQALKAQSPSSMQMFREEIIDSVVRAECLADIQQKAKSGGRLGGQARANKMAPLKNEVGRRFIENYSHFPNSKAAEIIEAELISEKSPLWHLSKAENKAKTFTDWIGGLLNNEWQLPVQI